MVVKQVGEPMPRYFFDIDDGVATHHDKIGSELPDEHAVRDEATGVMAEMARDYLPKVKQPQKNLGIWVCDQEGKTILHLALTFAVKPLT